MAIPPVGPSTPAPTPSGVTPSILDSPFAKMFAKTGVAPTAQEMQQIMNGILKQEVDNIKKSDDAWKRAMQKMKEAIKGE